MAKFRSLKRQDLQENSSNNAIMTNFMIRGVILFSCFCILLLMFFVTGYFDILNDLMYSSWLIVFCFGITIAVSLQKKLYLLQQIISVLYFYGTISLLSLLERYDNEWSFFFSYYFSNVLFLFIFLISRTYVNATLSVLFIVLNLNRLFLAADSYFFYYFTSILFLLFTLSQLWVVRLLMLFRGVLERYYGWLLGLMLGLFLTIYEMNMLNSLLHLNSNNTPLNLMLGVFGIVLTVPTVYKSTVFNPYFNGSGRLVFIISLLCIALSCFNLLILFPILIALHTFNFKFNTGFIVGLIMLFVSLVYTFFSKEAHLLFTIIVLFVAGFLLLLLYFRIKNVKHEES